MTTLSPEDRQLEQRQQEKYRFYYDAAGLDFSRRPATDYFAKLARLRLTILREAYRGGRVLDLGCGAGDYLLPVAGFTEQAIGVDFSPELVARARERAAMAGGANVSCLLANARQLPLATGSVALAFSFSALYYMPGIEQVVAECGRVLAPGGTAVLEFGILSSLNTLVCRAYPDIAAPCHVPLARAHRAVAAAGLRVEVDRAFQVLPLWGDRPRWLAPLLHPWWKRLLAREVGGRMLDERLSSLSPLRRLAFRHVMICRRAG